jgi:hypothetical protein
MNNELMVIPTSSNNCDLFSSILMATLYSQYSHDLILNKMKIKNDISIIIKKITKNYHFNNPKTQNFFKIILPEIILLKFLKFTHNKDDISNMIKNKYFNIDITYISNIYNIINLPFLTIHYLNNKYYIHHIPIELPFIIIIYHNYHIDNTIELANYDFNYKNNNLDLSSNIININGINYILDSTIFNNFSTHLTFNNLNYLYSHNSTNDSNDLYKIASIYIMMII